MNPTTSAQLPDGLREAIARLQKDLPDFSHYVLGNARVTLLSETVQRHNADVATVLAVFTPPASPAVSDEARKAATPRTDALRGVAMTRNDSDDFARTLERELTASQAATAEKQAECERLKAQLAEGREQWRMSSVCREQEAEIERLTKALSENDRLKQELAALAGDKARIDLLQQMLERISDRDEYKTTLKIVVPEGKTVRHSLDSVAAAMSAEQGKEARS